jgi:acetyl-CoA carboxylase carboxyl transferase subunit beta
LPIAGGEHPDEPMEAFLKCQGCGKTLYSVELEQNLRVCMHCSFHHKLRAQERIAITFDEGTFEEIDGDLKSGDPLEFPDYGNKLSAAEAKTGTFDSVVAGLARIDDSHVSVAVTDFAFMGGSMGAVGGEKISRTLERAYERHIPAIIFCASGGGRMQEGLLSLMQLAKTVAVVQRCRERRVPFIAVYTDPTMAGVLASYASVADVILSEPGAMVGFAGARVSKQAQVSRVPDDFQTAEYAFNHGMIDRIVPRKEMRPVLSTLVRLLGGRRDGA